MKTTERRRHFRFPLANGLMEPITIEFQPPDGGASKKVPAILTNLSAGGMSIVLFCEPPHTKEIDLALHLPGLHACRFTAKILRVHSKGDVYTLGLVFVKITKKDQSHINQLALDFNDCETRISLGLPEACVPTCCYHTLCSKPQKTLHWPPRA